MSWEVLFPVFNMSIVPVSSEGLIDGPPQSPRPEPRPSKIVVKRATAHNFICPKNSNTTMASKPYKIRSAAAIFFEEMEASIGKGPTRFAPEIDSLRSVETQLEMLSPSEKDCLLTLKNKWELAHPEEPFADEVYLRFARCSPGKKFDEKSAWKTMKSFEKALVTLSITDMKKQLYTKTLFPVPGLKSKDGHDFFYMRPSRFSCKDTPTEKVINNLCYVMNCMVEKESACADGICFLANMDDWTMRNFCTDYCFQFMSGLQGKKVPVRVNLFLIVNPPSWFNKIWAIMKPMLAPEFRKKVHMIKESQLSDFLADGFESNLPDDMSTGKASTEQMIRDFAHYRKYIERVFVDDKLTKKLPQ